MYMSNENRRAVFSEVDSEGSERQGRDIDVGRGCQNDLVYGSFIYLDLRRPEYHGVIDYAASESEEAEG